MLSDGIYKSKTEVYEGTFKNNYWHGKGKYKNKKTGEHYQSYEGGFNMGVREGYGILFVGYLGEKYSGQFKNNMRHGYGEWNHLD